MNGAPDPTYRERLFVPLRWWVQGTMLIATLWLALVVAVPGVVAWGATAFALGLLALLLLGVGGARVAIEDGVLHAGRAHIAGRHLGAVQALDAEHTRRLAGREADVRAFLVLRPYLKRAVRIDIADPADPAPYWLVSSRRPDELAAAVSALRAPSQEPRPSTPDAGDR